jgi:hypothetical protein
MSGGDGDLSTFDPFSVANSGGSLLMIMAVVLLGYTPYLLGKYQQNRTSWTYQLSFSGLSCGVMLYIAAFLVLLHFD